MPARGACAGNACSCWCMTGGRLWQLHCRKDNKWVGCPTAPPTTHRHMGSSSFTTIGSGLDDWSHSSWNHWDAFRAPQSHEPEAFDTISLTGRHRGGGKNEIPFYFKTKRRHHARSHRNSMLRRIGWGHRRCSGTAWMRLIILQRNAWPDQMTLHTWFKNPINDSSSRREHASWS